MSPTPFFLILSIFSKLRNEISIREDFGLWIVDAFWGGMVWVVALINSAGKATIWTLFFLFVFLNSLILIIRLEFVMICRFLVIFAVYDLPEFSAASMISKLSGASTIAKLSVIFAISQLSRASTISELSRASLVSELSVDF